MTPGPVDALLAATPEDSWVELPDTMMKDVCPQPYEAYLCASVIGAWGGGAYDIRRDQMLIFGGGHADSFYNILFAFELGPMKWSRLTELPPGATSASATPAMNMRAAESCGFYPKDVFTPDPADLSATGYLTPAACERPDVWALFDEQQPRSYHTYDRVVYDPVHDQLCYMGGGFSWRAAQGGAEFAFCHDFATRRWRRLPRQPETNSYAGGSAVDSRGHIWLTGRGSTLHLLEYDPDLKKWTVHSASDERAGASDIDRRGRFVTLDFPYSGGGKPSRVFAWDLHAPKQRATELVTRGDIPVPSTPPPFAYSGKDHRFVTWLGGKDVYVLDPDNLTWTRRTPGGVTPPPPKQNGTYGRFRYSVGRNVFVLVNDTSQNVFVYKPPSHY